MLIYESKVVNPPLKSVATADASAVVAFFCNGMLHTNKK